MYIRIELTLEPVLRMSLIKLILNSIYVLLSLILKIDIRAKRKLCLLTTVTAVERCVYFLFLTTSFKESRFSRSYIYMWFTTSKCTHDVPEFVVVSIKRRQNYRVASTEKCIRRLNSPTLDADELDAEWMQDDAVQDSA